MGHDGDSGTPPVEQPPPSHNSSRKRRDEQRNRKRKPIISSETETCISLRALKPDLTNTFGSCTRGRAKYCDLAAERGESKRRKSSGTPCLRKWTYSDHDVSNYHKVVIMSYNVLGVENAAKHPELYRGVSPRYLDWEYRKQLLCREVKSYQASILGFQEVDHFDDLNEILGKYGFSGLHKVRAGETCDGCAIFWKADLFTLLHEENLEFQKFVSANGRLRLHLRTAVCVCQRLSVSGFSCEPQDDVGFCAPPLRTLVRRCLRPSCLRPSSGQ